MLTSFGDVSTELYAEWWMFVRTCILGAAVTCVTVDTAGMLPAT